MSLSVAQGPLQAEPAVHILHESVALCCARNDQPKNLTPRMPGAHRRSQGPEGLATGLATAARERKGGRPWRRTGIKLAAVALPPQFLYSFSRRNPAFLALSSDRAGMGQVIGEKF
jgi:hypothetical protein